MTEIDDTGNTVKPFTLTVITIGDTTGTVKIQGIGHDISVKEVSASGGFNGLKELTRVKINNDNNDFNDGAITGNASSSGTYDPAIGGDVQIINRSVPILPFTGGLGTKHLFGAALVIGTVVEQGTFIRLNILK